MQGADRRAQLLAAATALISERGYWGLSLNDVATACGLTLPGLLHHFGSKSALLVAVLDHRDELDIQALSQGLGLDTNLGEADDWGTLGIGLADVCDALVDRNANQREIVRLYTVLEAESLTPDHPAQGYFAERQRRVLLGLSQLVPEGENREHVARNVLALLDGLQIQWLREEHLDLREAWRAIARQVPHLSERAVTHPSR
jgi:AcrR family transcriptional regulator